MKLSKKIMALAAGMVLSLGLSISLTSCDPDKILDALQKYLEMTEEETEDAEAASEAAPTSTTESATKSDSAVGGTFQFNIASTGNTNTLHYYDTSSTNIFSYENDGENYDNCYYQFQFSYKSKGQGKWYLYMRSGSKVLSYNDDNSDSWGKVFIAYGTYTGNCFDASDASVTAGELKLFTQKGNDWATINISKQETDPTSSFNVTFAADGSSSGTSISSARADAVEK